ncbi:MsnO8 family LLM class oxidoreductase [Oceanobacillus sp. 143]|uniref:LLM class flavin-dependent oxidoreductase n=1 Tax=Oceanobacillus zhaokaii TaxID=2052660 RepID=A0A345PIS5_9BACI|nr:LLM class flavin-dependent oxidoreductase [Oceanobacillus zhaokaii]AXI09905.1 LLM class flavin-dependent oxidoreductase [Oceanobacillus zhaokaii]QGS69121.1 MsnO8 family LLM class oxidoreductase [Oceanobacillus sp. 143]
MKLSILDQAPVSSGYSAKEALEATIELAMLAEKLGYTRYWVAEHHDLKGLASPAPDILLGIIGSQTERIRIGSGAVLLPNYKPFNIAERYNLLATLYPERVDIGLGRAPGGSAETSIALAGNFLEQVKKMPELLDELHHFLHHNFPADHIFSKVSAAPMPTSAPVPWLLGTSKKSAILAAEKGMPYVFGHFMSDQEGPSIVKTYRNNLKQGIPEIIITVSVICAETTEEAEEMALSNLLWRVQQDKGKGKDGVPSIDEAKDYLFNDHELVMIEKMKEKQIIGNPQEVRAKLEKLQAVYQTDEIMIVTITHDYEARRKSYQLIAEACDLEIISDCINDK